MPYIARGTPYHPSDNVYKAGERWRAGDSILGQCEESWHLSLVSKTATISASKGGPKGFERDLQPCVKIDTNTLPDAFFLSTSSRRSSWVEHRPECLEHMVEVIGRMFYFSLISNPPADGEAQPFSNSWDMDNLNYPESTKILCALQSVYL